MILSYTHLMTEMAEKAEKYVCQLCHACRCAKDANDEPVPRLPWLRTPMDPQYCGARAAPKPHLSRVRFFSDPVQSETGQ